MNEKELKQMIVSILEGMAVEGANQGVVAPAKTESCDADTANIEEDGILDDITEVNIRTQFLVPDPYDREGYLKMKERTPARLGLWRAGPRYKTQPLLRFRADHAAAQDAVFSYVSDELIEEMNFVSTITECQDKDEYVTRPDLGRRFDEENAEKIKKAVGPNPKIVMMVGDGLSSAAIEANIKDVLPSIQEGLKTYGLSFDEKHIIFVKHARVGAMDHIGEITGADVVCCLIGERPGLVTSESMSAYVAYRPTVGMPEANRTVISNIHQGGTPAVEAGAYIAELIKRILEHKKSGLDLKEAE